METLVKDTKEYMPIVVKDKLGNLITLDGVIVQYKITDDADDPTTIVDWTAATNDEMVVLPLVDTTLAGFVPGTYNLYVRLNIAPEIPILGPFEFMVV